jgi:hypothetical protein
MEITRLRGFGEGRRALVPEFGSERGIMKKMDCVEGSTIWKGKTGGERIKCLYQNRLNQALGVCLVRPRGSSAEGRRANNRAESSVE